MEGELAKFAVTVNGLKIYADKNENVLSALEKLQMDFRYNSANAEKSSAKIMKDIASAMDKLKATLEQEEWDEKDVLHQIKLINAKVSFYVAEGVKS